jgi:thymidylate synthase (FAD)
MKIIKPDVELITPIDGKIILKRIEQCGRVCYKSEDKITEDSAVKFV